MEKVCARTAPVVAGQADGSDERVATRRAGTPISARFHVRRAFRRPVGCFIRPPTPVQGSPPTLTLRTGSAAPG